MKTARELRELAWDLREDVVKMLGLAGSGHPASSLGLAEFFAVMYGSVLRYRKDDALWSGRDVLVVSNGHVVPVWYASLARSGFFNRSELDGLRKMGSLLQGHPHARYDGVSDGVVPGIENTGGPLGQGVSFAVGKMVGLRLKRESLMRKYGYVPRVFCLVSDGELQEGQVWEAFQFAVHEKLKGLVFVVDSNGIQIDGFVRDIQNVEPLSSKLESFGFYVREVDGNDVDELVEVFESVELFRQPSVVVMKTVPGKGVGFMENKWEWHGKSLSDGDVKRALSEIKNNRWRGI